MARVLGIGGLFFRASDPESLAAWYEKHLGINQVPTDYDTKPWSQEAGPTVFAPFAKDTDYFGRKEQQFMLNLHGVLLGVPTRVFEHVFILEIVQYKQN